MLFSGKWSKPPLNRGFCTGLGETGMQRALCWCAHSEARWTTVLMFVHFALLVYNRYTKDKWVLVCNLQSFQMLNRWKVHD
jgi:hypothetical protein